MKREQKQQPLEARNRSSLGMAPEPVAKAKANPVIDVRDITRTYGKGGINPWTGLRRKPTLNDPVAVDSIRFQVYPGEVYGLLGTNGAGKTSTLELIEGLAEPAAGHVYVFGKRPARDRVELRPHMGIMLQHGGLPQELTVLETLKMWAGTCSDPLPVEQVLGDVELSHRLHNKVGSLSGGEQRRLDLACALVGNPSLIFLDEPTTGLDPESRRNTWRLLEQLKSRGVTMVLTTHYLEEAEQLCDRIAIMHRGRIELEGTLSELVATMPATLRFTSPIERYQLPELPGTTVELSDGRVLISTFDLQQDTLRVLSWAAENKLQLEGFSASPASLEALFLKIAGNDAGPAA